MIRRSVREWGYLDVGDSISDGELPRPTADGLLAAARASRLGGADGEQILIDGRRRLRAQQVVGVLTARDTTLEILPKIDSHEDDDGATRRLLVHMLARVFDLEVACGAIADHGWQRDDLLEIIIRLFCERLFEAVHRGLPRRYVGQEGDLPALRGRLDAQRQFTVLAASPQKLACLYDELSPDIALNQIMKAAVVRLRSAARSAENQRRLYELAFAFADVSPLSGAALPWDRVVLDRTNATWSTLLTLARLLLGDRFQTTSRGDDAGFSLLFEMNALFEEYVGRTLRRALAGSGYEVTLQGPRSHALLGEDGVGRFATRPDIVVSHGGRPVVIVDTKWKRLKAALDDPKRGVGQADVYQMMAYGQVYGCGRLLLLYPHHNEIGGEEGVLHVHRISGTQDVRLGVASVSLGELPCLGDRLKTVVLQMLDTRAPPGAAA